ncbi:PRP39 [Candida pseudojiufengensis]|uniref:PRP39 n=1 Tax=Candida pseudojiufengensis TaxID=497109 RepID=UPI0022254D42|nr:PRP39 [Candida pseudojiufengensis]KAI5963316.1 PRP39 [Candida pseudojiufengensis]
MSSQDLLLPHDLESNKTDSFQSNADHISLEASTTNDDDKIVKDPNNLDSWNQLFVQYDDTIDQSISQDDPTKNSLNQETKTKIHNAYKTLLSRFPYLEEFWKKWSVVEYKMNGKNASIDILRMAVENFPNSVSLWSNYLSALKVVDEIKNIEKFRHLYNIAIDKNGYHFNSESIWDKVLEFETNLAKEQDNLKSKELLELYLKIVKIPLYQYAKYYTQFSEINKNYDINLLIPSKDLNDYVVKFGKKKIEDLSLIEKHQIIDDYFASVFAQTQAKVSSCWEFEQSLLNQDFSIDRTETSKELNTWINYLDREIRIYNNLPFDEFHTQFNLVVNLFERSIIPNCYNSDLWIKYIKFIYNSKISEDEKYEKQQLIYNIANSKFIPLNDNKLRKMFSKFLQSYDKFKEANEYLFDWIKLFSGVSKQYYKAPYLEIVNEIVLNWGLVLTPIDFQKLLEQISSTYYNVRESKIKKGVEEAEDKEYEDKIKEETSETNKSLLQLPDKFVQSFTNFLNDDSIPIIVVRLLQIYKHQNQPIKIRDFFNQNYTHNSLIKSFEFWKFIFEYEAQSPFKNLENLKLIYNVIINESNLTKSQLDIFIDWYYDISCANINEILNLNGMKSDDTLILKDLNLSNSLFYNKLIRKHQEKFNYKISNTKKNNNKFENEDPYLSYLSKQAGHPGILIESNPEITNKFTKKNNWIDLTKRDLQTPSYPTYKGVEKAQSPIKYPND